MVLGCAASPEPEGLGIERQPESVGRVAPSVVRRLSRREYDRTVHDLLGTTSAPGQDFPADDVAHGFDTMAQLLTVSPIHLDLYERAADHLVTELSDDPERWAAVLPCASVEPDACASEVIDRFAPRAWRRPITDDERTALRALFHEAFAREGALRPALGTLLRALLLSPHFLFRIEQEHAAGGAQPVSNHELASRLSYFLWGTMPDDALFASADAGVLVDPEVLEAHARRMIDDPRIEGWIEDFAGQWLSIRALDDVFRDVVRYPQFDEPLRAAMQEEIAWLFRAVLEESLDVRELLRMPRTFANARLRQHLGVPSSGEEEPGIQEIDGARFHRRGLLTTAGWLTATSPPFRTSPTQRGKWILSQLLCQPPQPPPPDVSSMDEEDPGASVRDRLEAHRRDPACAGCHVLMDPLGLAFENYDAVGSFRRTLDGETIDASGVLPEGRAFADALELTDEIAEDPAFVRCVVRQVFTFSLGRPPEGEDEPHLDAIDRAFAASGYRWSELLVAVIRSGPFRQRQSQESGAGAP